MLATYDDFSLTGKFVMNISIRQSVLDYLEREKPKRVYLCRNLADCKKYINSTDVLVIDDYFENENQYCLLKNMIQYIFRSDFKDKLAVIIIRSELKDEDEKIKIYKRLIGDYLEAMIKLKGLDKKSKLISIVEDTNEFKSNKLLV